MGDGKQEKDWQSDRKNAAGSVVRGGCWYLLDVCAVSGREEYAAAVFYRLSNERNTVNGRTASICQGSSGGCFRYQNAYFVDGRSRDLWI